ncbi:hypothetical protein [Aeromonas sp. MdU4]|uniref:hypothetical protein n=1 Tax=Aeromonas sp. MdU4 TaxID=3342819 RepID=UPI0035B8E0E3
MTTIGGAHLNTMTGYRQPRWQIGFSNNKDLFEFDQRDVAAHQAVRYPFAG